MENSLHNTVVMPRVQQTLEPQHGTPKGGLIERIKTANDGVEKLQDTGSLMNRTETTAHIHVV